MSREKLPLSWRVSRLPKRGHTPEEYEDASAANPQAGRFAVADGASESSFAALWARLLVEGYVQPQHGKADWLTVLRRRWAEEVDSRELPWYAEAKREQGAFATVLGLMLQSANGGLCGRWRAHAVGDTCLFLIRSDRLVRSFPLRRAGDFNNQPSLLGSRIPAAAGPSLWRTQGKWEPNDRFMLMTDALAQWFLSECEGGRQPWLALSELLMADTSGMAFTEWIMDCRQRAEMRNDDVTLVAVDLTRERWSTQLALPEEIGRWPGR